MAHKQNLKPTDILSLQNNLIKLSKKNTKLDIKVPSPSLPANAKPALDGLDDLLVPHLDFRHGYFIEAGANDGYTFSNTYYLENTLGWEGLLAEGIKILGERYEMIAKLFMHDYLFRCREPAKMDAK